MKRTHRIVKLAKLSLNLVLMVGGASLASAAVGDWPQWRGPNRDDISKETGLLKEWPKDGPTLVWKAEGLGGATSGYSSVAVSDGKIFTMGSFPNHPEALAAEKPAPPAEPGMKKKKNQGPPIDETTAVYALDLAGKQLWKTDISKTTPQGAPDWSGARGTPTVDGKFLYVIGDSGELVCLSVDDGKLVWHKNLKSELAGSIGGWAYTESPTIDGDRLICCPGGKNGTVAALDKKTGDVIWRSKDLTDQASYASLVPATIGGVHQFVILTPSSVAGIADDGAVLWKTERIGKTAVIPTPVIKDNLVYVTSGYGVGCNAFKIEHADGKFTVEKAFDNTNMKVHHGGVVVIGDNVYGMSDPGILTCMSLKDGSVVWKDRSVGKGSVTYADGRLYVRAEGSGDIGLVEATADGYKEHGLLKQPQRSKRPAWSHPVIAGGKLYVRDQGLLFCYDIKEKLALAK